MTRIMCSHSHSMNTQQVAFIQGFVEKCASRGWSPEQTSQALAVLQLNEMLADADFAQGFHKAAAGGFMDRLGQVASGAGQWFANQSPVAQAAIGAGVGGLGGLVFGGKNRLRNSLIGALAGGGIGYGAGAGLRARQNSQAAKDEWNSGVEQASNMNEAFSGKIDTGISGGMSNVPEELKESGRANIVPTVIDRARQYVNTPTVQTTPAKTGDSYAARRQYAEQKAKERAQNQRAAIERRINELMSHKPKNIRGDTEARKREIIIQEMDKLNKVQ